MSPLPESLEDAQPGVSPPAEDARLGQQDRQDQALLKRIALRDRHALEALYRAYHGRLSRFLSRVCQRQELAEEVLNEVFWIAWQKAGEFRGASQVSTWLTGIAYRCMLKALRQSGPQSTSAFEELEAMATGEDIGAEQERREWLAHGLSRLPPEQRSVLELAYYLGHSLEEIAVIIDCPESTVKARMFHARVKLRNLLPQIGGLRRGEVT